MIPKGELNVTWSIEWSGHHKSNINLWWIFYGLLPNSHTQKFDETQ